jgi:hypothetical protein
MVYRRSLVSSVWLHKLAKHACMGRRNPTWNSYGAFTYGENQGVVCLVP